MGNHQQAQTELPLTTKGGNLSEMKPKEKVKKAKFPCNVN